MYGCRPITPPLPTLGPVVQGHHSEVILTGGDALFSLMDHSQFFSEMRSLFSAYGSRSRICTRHQVLGEMLTNGKPRSLLCNSVTPPSVLLRHAPFSLKGIHGL